MLFRSPYPKKLYTVKKEEPSFTGYENQDSISIPPTVLPPPSSPELPEESDLIIEEPPKPYFKQKVIDLQNKLISDLIKRKTTLNKKKEEPPKLVKDTTIPDERSLPTQDSVKQEPLPSPIAQQKKRKTIRKNPVKPPKIYMPLSLPVVKQENNTSHLYDAGDYEL